MQRDVPRETRTRFDQSGIRYVEIDSGNVDGMRDSNADAIIADISAKSAKFRYSTMLFWLSSAIIVFAWAALHQQVLPFTSIVFVAYFIGKWLDSFLRVAVLMYDLVIMPKLNLK